MAELDCAECGDGIDDLSADDVVAERAVAGIVRKTQFACYHRQVGHRGRQIQLELGLDPSEVARLPDAQLLQPSQPVLRHHS